MNKFLCGTMLLGLTIVSPIPTMAGVSINIGISLPPPIVFQTPPAVIVLPDTVDVYVVPDIKVELFFWNGWWWRLWEGRWYRSHYYDRGWAYYRNVPSFYFDVDPGWRRYYRQRDWHGHSWDYEVIPYRSLHENWRQWHNSRHWERQRYWGVRNYKPQPQKHRQELRRERQEEYNKRPDVQRHRQEMREQQGQQRYEKQPGGGQQHRQHSQPHGDQHHGSSTQGKSQEKSDRKKSDHGK